MPIQKARINLALEAYSKRLEELFIDVDGSVMALYIDVILEHYGYRTVLRGEKGMFTRYVDFCFPYSRHGDVDVELRGMQSDLYTPGKDDFVAPVELYSEFPNREPSEELVRRTARSHAEYTFFYLTDGWTGDKFKLNELVPMLKFVQREKEEGVKWLKFERKEHEIKVVGNN